MVGRCAANQASLGGGRGMSACRFCEVPGEESRRYLVLHAGFPDGAELLDPFSRALE